MLYTTHTLHICLPLHIQQWDGANDGSKEIWPHSHHIAHQQSTVTSPANAQMTGAGDSTLDQIFRYSDEIFVSLSTKLLITHLDYEDNYIYKPLCVSLSEPPGANPDQTRRRRGCSPPRSSLLAPATSAQLHPNTPVSC